MQINMFSKKLITLALCLWGIVSFSSADVTLRFWDNGVLIHTATETENRGSRTLTNYYNEATLRSAGHLAECDGYTFAGWKVSSPIVNETVYASDAASGVVTSVTIGTSDIDLYAVYEKTVTYYSRIGSTSKLTDGAKYLIVGKNGSNYYALGNQNIGSSTVKGVNSVEVSPCADNKIYSADVQCIWTISKTTKGGKSYYTWRNDNNSKYIYLEGSYFMWFLLEYYDICDDSAPSGNDRFNPTVSSNVWTIKTYNNYYLYFAISNNFSGLNSYSNIFTVGVESSNVPTSTGDIYLYKQGTERRYKSKCGAYTLELQACGENSCSAVSVSPTSLTETQTSTTCVGLAQFSGVNPAAVTPTIDCSTIWDFAGWATARCADQTVAAPSFVSANPYALYHQNDTLFAVYRHKTNGTPDYYSSYPACATYTVTFRPCGGLVNSSSADYPVTEASTGAGVTTPTATFSACGGWTFAGWATEACMGADAAPVGLIAASATYVPATDGIKLYAVYTNSSRWTSYPVCVAADVTLNAVTGTIGGNTTKVLTEVSAGSGVTLEAATTSCSGTWVFAGWSHSIVATTTTEPSLLASGSTYHPVNANDMLYAVYYRGSVPNRVWTSSPSCSAYSVVLHACGAEDCASSSVGGLSTKTLTEASIGAGITFPAATTECGSRWEFVGWHAGSPIAHKYTAPDDLHAEDDLYIPTQDNEAFYAVYGHVTNSVGVYDYWTSNPDCTPYTVSLHACEGTLAGGAHDADSTETVAGNGIVLPTPTPLCNTRGWTFLGWVEGGELGTTQDIAGLTILSAGTRFKPIRNNIQLYAVYSISGYKQVSSVSELNTSDEYVIAFYWDYGNSYTYSDFALSNQQHAAPYSDYLSLTPIGSYNDEEGNKYVTVPNNNCKWRLGGDNVSGWTFRSVANNQYVYTYQNYADIITSASSTAFTIDPIEHTIERKTYSDDYRYWHFLNVNLTTFYVLQDDNPNRCDLYRAVGAVYSSWPHCAEYTVNFDGCDGIAGTTSLTEEYAGKGVVVPNVSGVCDGWTFAGWATSPYEEKTGTLTRNLYPAGVTYVPDKNNATLYAVYYQTKDTFEMTNGISDMYAGVNYLIVYDGSKAMSNTLYAQSQGWGINEASVSPSAGKIINPANALKWRLLGREGHYTLYNANAAKYLDLGYLYDGYYYASLSATATDNFSITYASDSYFLIRSNIMRTTLRHPSDQTYFDCYNYTSNSNTYIKLYRQKADYWSYPCSQPVEPMKWGDGTVTVESLTLSGAPTSASANISSIAAGEDDTYVITYSAKPGSKLRISWGGTYYRLTVPYVATPTYTPAVKYLPKYDLVLLPNSQFTVTLNTNLHTLSVYEDAELIVSDGETLTVDTLYVRSEGTEHHPSIMFGGSSASIVVNSGIIYHDRRIDDRSYYPFGIPYDADLSQLKYAGLIANNATPVQNSNYWVKYYDGAARAVDVNEGRELKSTYWKKLMTSTVSGGAGYSIGIADNTVGNHIKRTLRFRMTPIAEWNTYEDGTNDRAITISPSEVRASTMKHHSGWNFISNPYLHTYYPGNVDASSGLLTGHFEQENGRWVVAQDETQAIPYLTFFDASGRDYYQSSCISSYIRPFTAVFVQVEENDMLLFQNPLAAEEAAPAPRRNAPGQKQPITRTGLIITNGAESSDETGLVISNRYTTEYEVGADLAKMANNYNLHIYTLNGSQKLAFNALDTYNASLPIPVGIIAPQTGSYTFRFDEKQYSRDAIEGLWLTDYEMHETVNLLDNDYTCLINAGVNESRFAINAIVATENPVTTDMQSVENNGLYLRTDDDGNVIVYSNDLMTDVNMYDMAGRWLGTWTPNSYQCVLNVPQGVYALTVQCENRTVSHMKVCVK